MSKDKNLTFEAKTKTPELMEKLFEHMRSGCTWVSENGGQTTDHKELSRQSYHALTVGLGVPRQLVNRICAKVANSRKKNRPLDPNYIVLKTDVFSIQLPNKIVINMEELRFEINIDPNMGQKWVLEQKIPDSILLIRKENEENILSIKFKP